MIRKTELPFIIDLHTHVFNANYVPLNEILVSKNIPKRLAKLLSRLILQLTAKSRMEAPDYLSSKSIFSAEELFDTATDLFVYGLIDSFSFSQNEKKSPDGVLDNSMAVFDSPLHDIITKIDYEFGDQSSRDELDREKFLNKMSAVANKDALGFDRALYGLFGSVRKMLKRFLRKCLKYVEEAGDMLDFLLTMMRSEKSIFRRLSSYYDKYDIRYLLVHHMMDMDHPFGGRSKFEFYTKQIPRMRALERFSSGTLLGFSAFDPIRFVESDSSNLKESIEESMHYSLIHEKAGFKFYPPMGYKAAGNEPENKLELVVDIFFDYCLEHDIPVFTHCTPAGFEVVKGESGSNSHPKFWAEALRKNPKRKDLRICFGHSGGGTATHKGRSVYGWMAKNDDQWMDEDNYTRQVIELCRQYPNVYCEVAYLDEIIHSDSKKQTFIDRFAEEYSKDTSSNRPYNFQDKVMYGSDWHMPSMVNDIDTYLGIFMEIFKSPPLNGHMKGFFYQNALEYLQLDMP